MYHYAMFYELNLVQGIDCDSMISQRFNQNHIDRKKFDISSSSSGEIRLIEKSMLNEIIFDNDMVQYEETKLIGTN